MFRSNKKKWMSIVLVAVFAMTLTGCRVATNADGSIKLITSATTFQEVFSSENWFNSILVYPMAQFLNKFSSSLTVGGALAAMTILVNLILMLLTMKSTIASHEMQLIQPELNKIQRKYEGKTDDQSRMKQANEMQALYNKYKINPTAVVLTQFIQFPVIIAMYHAVQRSQAIKTGSFFGLDLSIAPWAGIKAHTYGYIALMILLAVCQYISISLPQRMAKKRAKEEAERHHRRYEESKNKQTEYMQLYMMAMIVMFGFTWPAAMALYWSVNSFATILKTYAIQYILAKHTEARNA